MTGRQDVGAATTEPVRAGGATTVWSAYAAAVWMFAFGLTHIYWALDGRVGLSTGMSLVANKPLFIMDIAATPLCFVGGFLALALVRPWGRRFPRALLLTVNWGATLLMAGHALPTVIGDVVRLLSKNPPRTAQY